MILGRYFIRYDIREIVPMILGRYFILYVGGTYLVPTAQFETLLVLLDIDYSHAQSFLLFALTPFPFSEFSILC